MPQWSITCLLFFFFSTLRSFLKQCAIVILFKSTEMTPSPTILASITQLGKGGAAAKASYFLSFFHRVFCPDLVHLVCSVLRGFHTGDVTNVATPSNSSQALNTSQIFFLILPCAFGLVTGIRVCKMTPPPPKKKKKKVNWCQTHLQSCLSCHLVNVARLCSPLQ